jgi:hypothetical protein
MERSFGATLPNTWKEKNGENTFSLYDPDGVGALQFSS